MFDSLTGRLQDVFKSLRGQTALTPEAIEAALREIRLAVEKHIKNTYLKKVQAPVGVKPTLKCWMELN